MGRTRIVNYDLDPQSARPRGHPHSWRQMGCVLYSTFTAREFAARADSDVLCVEPDEPAHPLPKEIPLGVTLPPRAYKSNGDRFSDAVAIATAPAHQLWPQRDRMRRL